MSKLTFGKFKGEDICDVDLGYLKWLEQQEWLFEDLRIEINHEIERREGDRPGKGFERKKKDSNLNS